MPDKPAAELVIDEALVRRLVCAQAVPAIADAATLPLRKVAEGWDSEVWRLGPHHAVRLPRRALAAPLIRNEHRALPIIAPRVEATGVRVPLPVLEGAPDEGYPWAWSVVPWIEGSRGIDAPRPERAGWAAALAAALAALHIEAPADHPVNPVRGRPLATRAAAFDDRLRGLIATGHVDSADACRLGAAWSAGLEAPAWTSPPVWIHGDLHPGNLVAAGPVLRGIIDFGDVTAGDPAYDLAVAWLAFDTAGRTAFIAATGATYDAPTWTRAHAWAAAIAVTLLAHSDDNPDYAALGAESVREVVAAASPV
ncbi:phosphotransferase [Microbacterium sulfonylureivorans]|uniref:phosphotransferase n=1 Tax=Microbacterium sulfonylureivorans TaxID=2486854 RepID=UPI000FD737F0|nr:phosphotransferase [Microbacterium sulfonylureivorans]